MDDLPSTTAALEHSLSIITKRLQKILNQFVGQKPMGGRKIFLNKLSSTVGLLVKTRGSSRETVALIAPGESKAVQYGSDQFPYVDEIVLLIENRPRMVATGDYWDRELQTNDTVTIFGINSYPALDFSNTWTVSPCRTLLGEDYGKLSTTSDLSFNPGPCPICSEESSTPVILNCRHQFCWECLRRSSSKDCPICRGPISTLSRPHQPPTETFELTVKRTGGNAVTLSVSGSMTMEEVMLLYHQKEGPSLGSFVFVIDGKDFRYPEPKRPTRNSPLHQPIKASSPDVRLALDRLKKTVGELGLGSGSTVHAVLIMRGDIGVFEPIERTDQLPGSRLLTGDVDVAAAIREVEEHFGTSRYPVSIDPTPMLTMAQCQRLVRLTEKEFQKGDTNHFDFKMELTRDQLESSLDPATVSVLYQHTNPPIDKIYLRRSQASDKPSAIPFHLDVARHTVQIPLNPSIDYEGGVTTFVDRGSLIRPERRMGCPMYHCGTTPHGVSPITSGVRYGLFLLSM
jgi:hypothetical protein